jgi:DNA polymerase-3 subunit epsilon
MTISQNVREIVLDTETTGLSHREGDRIVDIACLELINHVSTGRTYQAYVNPQREMRPDATAISGITDAFLKDKPLFHEIVNDFLEFIGDSKLVIHNAKFDIGFINSELTRLNRQNFSMEIAIDTLEMARRKFPGAPANLDALCRRFEIDTSARTKHGALIDCYLLAEVYINLLGGRQSGLSFGVGIPERAAVAKSTDKFATRNDIVVLAPSTEELAAHEEHLRDVSSPIWNDVVVKRLTR